MASPGCIVVAGMHRSGTSWVSAILANAGVTPTSDLIPPHPVDNPQGYFESREVLRINNAFLASHGLSWKQPDSLQPDCFDGPLAKRSREEIRAFLEDTRSVGEVVLLKDPRFCRLLPLWLPELKGNFGDPIVVHVLRRVDAVYQSLARRAQQSDTVKAAVTSTSQAHLLWLHYNLELAQHARQLPYLVVAYESMVARPKSAIRQLTSRVDQLLGNAEQIPDARLRTTVTATNPASEKERVFETLYLALLEKDASRIDKAFEALKIVVPDKHQVLERDTDPRVYLRARLNHFTSRCEYRPIAEKRVRNAAIANVGRLLRRSQSLNTPSILFVSASPTSRGHLYRVRNAVDGLNRLGIRACWISVEMLAEQGMTNVDAGGVIAYRCPWNATIEELLETCRRRNTPVGFDIDDLIFDADLMRNNGIDFISRLSSSDRDEWLLDAVSYRRLMREVDFCIVPTQTLAKHAARANPNTYVIENGFCADTLALSDHWRDRRVHGPTLRIGYASGTNTHAEDFATIVHPLAEALRTNPNWRLCVVGKLSMRSFSGLMPKSQLEARPLVEHVNLAFELARFDVNLVPLQPGSEFCDAKSPLKYFEAALVGTPTIAKDNVTYKELIRNGENGFLAGSQADWLAGLESLDSDRYLRDRLSALAREECVARFHADKLAQKYRDLHT